MIRTCSYAAMAIFCLSVLPVKVNADISQSIVYIECLNANGDKKTRGSGVIISEKGVVLTAEHVTKNSSSCRGSIGVADHGNTRKMILKPTQLAVDAALLQFSNQAQSYQAYSICALEDWMVRRKIFVAGYPGGTETGSSSYREGILSTVLGNSQGVLETDGQTVNGMSGGPVFTNDLSALLGIVIGATFDASGLVSHYGILPIAEYAQQLNIDAPEQPCYRQSRIKSEYAGVNTVSVSWSTGQASVPLGMTSDEGICYVTGLFGELTTIDDAVSIELHQGQYHLSGTNGGGGFHGGTAACAYFQ